MHCLITAGPTFEPLDRVRRLTNFSTGSLGLEAGARLQREGHQVTVLLGEQATAVPPPGLVVVRFGTTQDLSERLRAFSTQGVGAVLHAAAVSDFRFGKVWQRAETGDMTELKSGKFTTRQGTLLAELLPTPKLIGELRGLFPLAWLVGWKYEVDGGREEAIQKAADQLAQNHTDACVVNGPAYGTGFGWLTSQEGSDHLASRADLLDRLARELACRQKKS